MAAAEQQAKALEMAHEMRVAGLEGRLAELSETVGGYDRLRQQDQQAIQKLKDQLARLQDSSRMEFSASVDSNLDSARLISTIRDLYGRLLDMDNKKSNSSNVQGNPQLLIILPPLRANDEKICLSCSAFEESESVGRQQ